MQTALSATDQLLAELRQLQEAALNSDYALQQVDHLCNKIGPRLGGSLQAQQAVEYVAAELRALGLDVQLEELSIPHWVRGEETAALVQYPGQSGDTPQRIILTALGGSVATPAAGITAELIVVEDLNDFHGLSRSDVEGRIVLFNKRFDRRMAERGFGMEAYMQAVPCRHSGPSAAARLGAVAALVRSVGGAAFRLPHTGSIRYAPDAPQIPAAAITVEDADLIARLARAGTLRMRLTLTPQQLPDAVSYNVIADLRGREQPDELVIVSGHLDSWDLGTGALDDAAGVAAAMAVVRLVKQMQFKPRRTIRVIAWMNEENGVTGGKTYARRRMDTIADHIAVIECDRGAGHPFGFEVMGKPELIDLLQPVRDVLESFGAGLMRRSATTETDITPLALAGVPAFGVWQDTHTYFDYHHTAADTFDKIIPKELAENAAAMAVLAYAIADHPVRLPK